MAVARQLAQVLTSLTNNVICKDDSPPRPTLYQSMLSLSSSPPGASHLGLRSHRLLHTLPLTWIWGLNLKPYI
jgi:hypothetical protein